MIAFDMQRLNCSRQEAAELVSRYLTARNAWAMSKTKFKSALWEGAMHRCLHQLHEVGIYVLADVDEGAVAPYVAEALGVSEQVPASGDVHRIGDDDLDSLTA